MFGGMNQVFTAKRAFFFVFIFLVPVCGELSFAKTTKRVDGKKNAKKVNKRRKTVKKQKNKSSPSSANCELDKDGKWFGKGCSAFMEDEESLIAAEEGGKQGSDIASKLGYGLDWVIHPFPRDLFSKTITSKPHC